jgi:Restriction endonuclease
MTSAERSLARRLWRSSQRARTAQARGRLFEYLMHHVFSAELGYSGRRRILTLDSEVDLLLQRPSVGLPDSDLFEEYLIVECKNTRSAISGRTLKNVGANVRHGGCRVGVLAAAGRLTGGSDGRADFAMYTLRKLYHHDGIVLVVLDARAIGHVLAGTKRLSEALRGSYEAIRFDLPHP